MLSSHRFLKASSGERGSKAGACCLVVGGCWRLLVYLPPLVFVVRYRSSACLWMCGWTLVGGEVTGALWCGSGSGSSCPGCSVVRVHGELSTFRRYGALRARARGLWSSLEVVSNGLQQVLRDLAKSWPPVLVLLADLSSRCCVAAVLDVWLQEFRQGLFFHLSLACIAARLRAVVAPCIFAVFMFLSL